MNLTIVHLGGAEKTVAFEGLDAPRPWIRVRYPNGGGVFSFALAHGAIECKRGEHPQWAIADSDLEKLRVLAEEQKIKFTRTRSVRFRRTKPGAPKRKTAQKQLGLFGEEL